MRGILYSQRSSGLKSKGQTNKQRLKSDLPKAKQLIMATLETEASRLLHLHPLH